MACMAGTYKTHAGRECNARHRGIWKAGPECDPCEPCAAGQVRSNCGVAEAGDCETPCAAGRYKAIDKTGSWDETCTDCPDGFYAVEEGAVSCEQCPTGHTSNAAAVALADGLAAAANSACTMCAQGRYQAARGQQNCEECAHCSLGQEYPDSALCGGVNSGSCADCRPGMYKDRGSTSPWDTKCVACPTCGAGKHRTLCGTLPWLDRMGVCAACPAGHHKEDSGDWDSGCEGCPVGLYSEDEGLRVLLAPDVLRFSRSWTS